MGPRAGLDDGVKSRLHRDSIPGPFSPWRVSITTELSRPKMYGCAGTAFGLNHQHPKELAF